MKIAIVESLGVATVLVAAAMPLSCIPQGHADLQPLVATSGQYALMTPAEKPQPAKCASCGGKRWLGDGTVRTPCPECNPEGK